jgi:hypothetical protein
MRIAAIVLQKVSFCCSFQIHFLILWLRVWFAGDLQSHIKLWGNHWNAVSLLCKQAKGANSYISWGFLSFLFSHFGNNLVALIIYYLLTNDNVYMKRALRYLLAYLLAPMTSCMWRLPFKMSKFRSKRPLFGPLHAHVLHFLELNYIFALPELHFCHLAALSRSELRVFIDFLVDWGRNCSLKNGKFNLQ